jgi:type II secretory pathway component GspD/PulD (secretin)
VDESLPQVIALFEKYTGKMVLRSQTLPILKINFNGTENLTRAQAIIALESLLSINGVTIVPAEGADFYKAVPAGTSTMEAPPLYTESTEKLLPSERVISRLFTLRNTTAPLIDPALRPLLNSGRGESLISYPTANALLLTASTNAVKKAEKIVAALDLPKDVFFYKPTHIKASDVKSMFTSLQTGGSPLRNILGGDFTIEADDLSNQVVIVSLPQNHEKIRTIIKDMDRNSMSLFTLKLKHIKASDVKTMLHALQTGQGSTTTVARPVGVAAAARPATTPNAFRNVLGGDIIIEADDLTNTLMIVTQPQIRDKICEVIEQMDVSDIPKMVTEVIGLKHSEVATVVNILETIVTGKTSATSGTGGATASRNTSSMANTRGGSSLGGTSTSVQSYRTYSFTNRRVSTTGVANTLGPTGAAVRTTVTTPGTPNAFSDYITVSGDERSNSLVVVGTSDDVAQIKTFISKIDVPLPQVRIEAIVVEVTLNNEEASGLDTLGLGYKSGATVGGITAPDYNYNTSSVKLPNSSNPPFALSGSLRDFSLSVVFGLAERNSRIRILSAPLLSTSHNQPANVFVGEERPVITSSTSDIVNTNTSRSTVESKKIGLDLTVTPRVGQNGSIEMKVDQSTNSVSGTVVIDGNEQPITAQRSASSYLIANHNETVVLAGLQSYRETESKGIMWLLGYIPFIGELFRPETHETTRTEIIIFIKPHIIKRDTDASIDATPGLTPGSLTRIDAKSYIDTGRFSAVSLTEDEREAIEIIRQRQNEQAAASRAEQLRNEQIAPPSSSK